MRARPFGAWLGGLAVSCSAPAVAPVDVGPAPPPPASVQLVAAPSAPPRACPVVRAVDVGYAVEPPGPPPARAPVRATAALVWEVEPAPANPSGPRARDAIVTRLVGQKGEGAEVLNQRDEAVFSSARALWHLVRHDVPVEVEDCANGGKRAQRVRKELVLQSLEPKPRRVQPMEGHVVGGEWARLDLDAMVGPWVVMTVDHFSQGCEGRPFGSAYRVVVDLDRAAPRAFPTPPGALAEHAALVRSVLARGCGGGADEIKAGELGFYYDRAGNLVADYGFFAYTAPVCFHGVTQVLVGSYDLPPEVAAHARLPAWLRAFLELHPSRAVAVIPEGREDAARKEFAGLPRVPAPLPRDSGFD